MAEESTVQLELTLTLPASLVREAEAQGLLTSPMLEALLRSEVQRRRVERLGWFCPSAADGGRGAGGPGAFHERAPRRRIPGFRARPRPAARPRGRL